MFISKFRSWSSAQRALSLIVIIGLFTSLGMTTSPIIPQKPDNPTSLPAPANGLYLSDGAALPGIVDHIESDSSLTNYYTRPTPVGGVAGPLTHFALSPNGTLYFIDGTSRTIYTVDASNAEVPIWTDQTQLNPVRDLGFDANGNLYYSVGTGIDNGSIYELNAAHTAVTLTYSVQIIQVNNYWRGDFAFDSSNNLYLSNGQPSTTNRIYQVIGITPTPVFTSTGEIAGFVRDNSGAFYFTDVTTGIYRTSGNAASLIWSIPAVMTVPDINLIGANGPVLTHFRGNVLYNPSRIQPQPGLTPATISSQGQISMPISVLGFVGANSAPIVLNSGLSQADGSFDLSVLGSGFDHFDVTQGTLRGTVPQTLTVPVGGTVLDVNTAKFGGSTTGSICCTNFNLADPVMKLPFFSQGRYLIVTSAALTGMIQDFVTFKEYQGYDVIVKTIEDLGGSGQALMKNIRNYEKTLLAESKALKYVLLIGTDKTVPYPKINEFGYDWYHMPSSDAAKACGFTVTQGNTCGWPSDWYYVDLNSNWDSSGDGVFGENFWPDPKGPAQIDAVPNFHPDVFLGRIPIDGDLSVWTALHAIMNFERDGGAWKDNTLMAGAMLDFGGQGWAPPDNVITGTYQNLSGPTDTGKMLEQEYNNILAAQGFNRTRMYEKDHPPTGYAPSSFPVDAPLDATQIITAFKTTDFGLLSLAGHGNAYGVYRLVWTHDYNLDGKVQNPEQPTLISSKWTSQYELDFADLFNTWYRGYYNSPNLKAPFLMAMSCSTGDAGNPGNLPATLLSEGQISGWTGGAGVIGYVAGWGKPSDGMAMTIDYDITGKIFKDHLPLGQGVWQGLNQYWNDMHNKDWGFIDWDFYGDPSMTYWSIGPDLSAPWPMFHYDMPGRGTTALTGPISPTLYWSSPIASTPLSGTAASPVIGVNGEIVIGDSAGDVREYDGLHGLLWTYHTGGAIVNAAVINSDGTIYVKSQDGYLYAIKSNGTLRWKLFEGNSEASPKVSGDGTIYVAGSDNTGPSGSQHYFIDSIQPNGTRNVRTYVDSRVTTTPAFDKNYSVYLGTANGTLYQMNFDLSSPHAFSVTPGSAIGNGLAVVDTNEVIVPSANHSVIAYNTWSSGSVMWTRVVSNVVQSAPAIADNVVYFGSRDGYVYAVNYADGSLLWKYNTGAPVDSAPAVDPTNVYVIGGSPAKLYALRRYDGALIWSYLIAGTSLGGSSPAIGYDGIYVGSSAGTIKLIGNYLYLKPPILLINPELVDIHIHINPGDPGPDSVVQLERRIVGGQWENLGTVNADYLDTNIKGGTLYDYRAITKINGTLLKPSTVISQPSNYTPPIEVMALTPLTGSISAPIVTPVSASQLNLKWSAVPTGTTVIMIIRKGPSDTTFITDTFVPGSVTHTLDSSLLPATTYTYTLVALGQGGDSMQSGAASGTTFAQTLIAPSNVTVSALSDTQFHVCWTPAPENPVGAAIGREANGEVEPLIVGTVISGTTCFDDVSSYPDTFVYFVKHVQGSNESPWAQSGPVSAPDAPRSISYVYLPIVLKTY
jgi:outer membrane protein assembly factor BamB